MSVDRTRCPSCGRKALRQRSRTKDFKCKECGEVYSTRYFDVEDALLRLLHELSDVLTPVFKSYSAPKRFRAQGGNADSSSTAGCLPFIIGLGAGAAIYFLTVGWAWYLQWGAAVGGGIVAVVVVAALLTPKSKIQPAPAQSGSPQEAEEYTAWCAANPVLASFDKGPFHRMLHGLMFFPEDPSHYEKHYVISRDGTTVELYQNMLKGSGITIDISDADVSDVVKAVGERSTPSNVEVLRRLLDRLVPLTRTGDTSFLLDGQPGSTGDTGGTPRDPDGDS